MRQWRAVVAARAPGRAARRGDGQDHPGHCAHAGAVRAHRVRPCRRPARSRRSEEHTSELQSLMRTSYAVFCLQKKTHQQSNHTSTPPITPYADNYHVTHLNTPVNTTSTT